jgi:16S rRNA (adenine1518-N6/adenine1519-N6)-dimethyltransferase
VHRERSLPPSVFFPEPGVDSALVLLERRTPREFPPVRAAFFDDLVQRGFSQRRKQLKSLLKADATIWTSWCAQQSLPPTCRAENLSVAQWIDLARTLDPAAATPAQHDGEQFDVVDENDNVIATRLRTEVHENNLLHRAVHVFLQNKIGEIYLQLRSHLKDTHPRKWDSSASGHVDPGESYLACAGREMWEEVWVQPKGEITRVARLAASESTDQEFIEVFLAEAKGKIRVHGKEVESGRWFSPEFIEEWIGKRPQDFATGFITCFKAWRAGY